MRLPSCDGRLPEISFSRKLSRVNEWSHDTSTGNVPAMRLSRKSNSRRTPLSSHEETVLEYQVHSSVSLSQPSFRLQVGPSVLKNKVAMTKRCIFLRPEYSARYGSCASHSRASNWGENSSFRASPSSCDDSAVKNITSSRSIV